MTEGYILVATQEQRFADRAANAARSIRFYDRNRPICLAHDGKVRAVDGFDSFVVIERKLAGTENQLFLNELSPFERTLYLDSDCLASSSKLTKMWEMFHEYPVAFPGRKITAGHWRMDVSRACTALGVDYLVQVNGGVFAFDRSPTSIAFFEMAQQLFQKRPREITVKHGSGGGIANEPYWSAALAKLRVPVFPLYVRLNYSTSRVTEWRIDDSPSLTVWEGEKKVEPIFCHFLGMKPFTLYEEWLRRVSRDG